MSHRGPFILVFALGQQLSTLLSRSMHEAPLRPDDFAVTSVIRLMEPVRPSTLATTIGMRPTTLSNYLRRLGDSGHVRRRPDPADGRAALISLTRKGTRDTEACFPGFGLAIETFQHNLKSEGIDQHDLLDLLEAMSRAIDATIEELDES
jgi:DNA-binding MarR family transcriptional regulator